MKKIMIAFFLMVFFVGVANADQGTRDDDSYRIYFEWSQTVPISKDEMGGYFYQHDSFFVLIAARTNEGFNLYAKNRSPDAETGAPVVNHSAYPEWYSNYGWDVPDASPDFATSAPNYLLTIDTYQGKWWLFYSGNPWDSIRSLYVPMSGSVNHVSFNDDGTIDFILKEDGGDWKAIWSWGYEVVKLDRHFFVGHLDTNAKTGYLEPRKLSSEHP